MGPSLSWPLKNISRKKWVFISKKGDARFFIFNFFALEYSTSTLKKITEYFIVVVAVVSVVVFVVVVDDMEDIYPCNN